MIVLLDAGNSRIKWGRLEGQGLRPGAPVPTQGAFEAALASAWEGMGEPSRVVASNVAGAEWGRRLDRWLRARFGIGAEFVASRAQGYGVTNGYRDPARLGVDRWVALVGLRHGRQGAACVVDVGTAATFDVLDGAGLHRGGAIMPGLELMGRSLVANTVQITDAEAADAGWLGDNTGAAIRCGSLNAVAGMAERLRSRACRELGESVAGVLTGGGAAEVAACLDGDWRVEPDLLLRGLAVIAGEAE
ncbi:type III pantothenate kinase [Methylogaea oryzae]|uniref:Type III pantothenate kinase n=2 Tax=Methylogaea oryzae TaxID=1295382 RepID=A0A8D4VPU2_9GAMM|nr:type III pantothenate kinase [Methylogaea oryzae]BBL71556.1 type III pantothenate kinase [Methylogaea oryzae]